MRLHKFSLVLLTAVLIVSFSALKVSAQDMLLQDLTPSAGKVVSIPADWLPSFIWYKGDSEQKVFDLLKASMTTPMSDSDAQKFLGSEIATAEIFAFAQGDTAPLMFVLLRKSAQDFQGKDTVTIGDVLANSSAKPIKINGRDSAYNLMGAVTDDKMALAVLYIEDGGKSVVMAVVFASKENWATQGNLLKQVVTSYRDAGQKLDTNAWKLIQMSGGDTASVTDTPEPTSEIVIEPADATATPKAVKPTPTKKPTVKKPTMTPTAVVEPLSGVILVYTSWVNNHWAVIGMYPQGDSPKVLTPANADCYSPAFAADGTKFLVICTTADAPEQEIYECSMDAECTAVTSHAADDGLKYATPCYSPDGSQIAYARYTQMTKGDVVNESEIVVSAADGSGEQTIGFANTLNWEPSWAPDGTKIVFISSNGTSKYDVFVAGPQGKPKQLTKDALNKRKPQFSPDGKRIAYYAYTGADSSTSQIYVMSATGAKVTKLSEDGNIDIEPAWSPDGYMLAFTRVENIGEKTETRSVWVMQDDGNNAEILTTLGQNSQHPTWATVGQ